MAVQSVTIEPDPTIIQFDGLPTQAYLENSPLPRAAVTFQSNSASIAAKTLGNTMQLEWRLTLPENYAYILCRLAVEIAGTADKTAVDFQPDGYVFTETASGGADREYFPVTSNGVTNFATTDVRVYVPGNMPTFPIYNQEGAAPRVRMFLYDDDTANAAAARTLYATARFLVFDIRQVTHVGVNSPDPVRVC